MFIFLSKKIEIPKVDVLKTLSWNTEQGWIACGGENGMLKVLKLTSSSNAGPSNLSMNQTLEGHNGSVVCSTWNSVHKKLTTSDEFGLIIVWKLEKGVWYEEMINNRNKSVVCDMKWTPDGQKICIAYKDGAVIVGSVGGDRLWGKELGVDLRLVEWSPDGRSVLFVTDDEGDVMLYDAQGNKITGLSLAGVVALDWHDGDRRRGDQTMPTLAIAFEDGRIRLTRGHLDENPSWIDTGMDLCACNWNAHGTTLAVAGTPSSRRRRTSKKKKASMIQFYSPLGHHLRTLNVPMSPITALSWERSGLRIGMTVGSCIFFANIRPDYDWAYFSNTLVYSFRRVADRNEECTMFWDTTSDEKFIKYTPKLRTITSAGADVCLLVSGTDDASGQFDLTLYNSIGNPVDSKRVDIEALYAAMSAFHVVVANKNTIYVWQYRTQISNLTSVNADPRSVRRTEGRQKYLHVDDSVAEHATYKEYSLRHDETASSRNTNVIDSICAMCVSDKYLMIARESGTIQRYTLPYVSLEDKYDVSCRPQRIALNCDSTRMSCIDVNGVLSVHNLDDDETGPIFVSRGPIASVNRSDTWDLVWAKDNRELFVVMEKTKMIVYRDAQPEEPILSSGYLCDFKHLKIKAILLDDVMARPNKPKKSSMMVEYQTKSLRDAKEILDRDGLKETYAYIEKNPHPQLWRMLAEAALDSLNLVIADKGFVRCKDYQGVQFVKRLRKLDDKKKQRAEVAAYFRRFDEAEQIYRDMDRNDLAIDLQKRLGDWFRVVQLVQSGAGDDELLQLAWNKIGQHYFTRQKYDKAMQYYQQAKNIDRLITCHFKLENYDALHDLISELPEGATHLVRIGTLLQRVGLHKSAVDAFVKAKDTKAAIDCCVLLNQWDVAVQLAETYRFPQIHALLTKYASNLLESGNTQGKINAVELYRKAKKSVEAATLLTELASDAARLGNFVRAKKFQVLAALEVEDLRARTLDNAVVKESGIGGSTVNGTSTKIGGVTTAQQTLAGLMTLETAAAETGGALSNTRAIDNAWRGAEAYHFYILGQTLLYRGNVRVAMECAKEIVQYDDILDKKRVYAFLGVTSFYNAHFATCSDAFVKLEGLDGVTASERREYQDLALSVFTRYDPEDPPPSAASGDKRKRVGRQRLCIASGRPLSSMDDDDDDDAVVMCKRCRHRAFSRGLRAYGFCPLCHEDISGFS